MHRLKVDLKILSNKNNALAKIKSTKPNTLINDTRFFLLNLID